MFSSQEVNMVAVVDAFFRSLKSFITGHAPIPDGPLMHEAHERDADVGVVPDEVVVEIREPQEGL